MAQHLEKGEWRYVMELSMAQSVMTHGMNWKLLLSVTNLDSHQAVGYAIII